MPEPLCIVTVHAHPDDEASKGAPTLARYKAEGVRTVLVCCTGGEEGDIHNPAMDRPEIRADMAAVRAAELAASAAIIGFDEVVMLGYRDSGMPDSEANHRPEAFWNAPIDESTGRLVEVIRRERPQVLITYNDDQQGYPHPDHLRVHDISVLAFERAGDPAWYPELGEPWQPAKLYYTVWSRNRLVAVHEALLRIKGESPFDEKWFERPDSDERITTAPRRPRLPLGPLRVSAGPRHPGRPERVVLVRAHRRRAGRRLPLRGLDPRPVPRRRAGAGHGRGRPVRRHPPGSSVVSTVQYRIALSKKDEIVTGPDDADLVVTVPVADVGLDPTVAYMQGKLKATGPTHLLFDILKSGEAATALRDAVADR